MIVSACSINVTPVYRFVSYSAYEKAFCLVSSQCKISARII